MSSNGCVRDVALSGYLHILIVPAFSEKSEWTRYSAFHSSAPSDSMYPVSVTLPTVYADIYEIVQMFFCFCFFFCFFFHDRKIVYLDIIPQIFYHFVRIMNFVVFPCSDTVELQWLEHLWDHRKLFEPLRINLRARSGGK